MPILSVYVDDRTYRQLTAVANEEGYHGRGAQSRAEELAEAAVAEAAMRAKPDVE